MKRNVLLTILAMMALMLCAAQASAQKKDKDKDINPNFEPGEQIERVVPASQNVVFSVCLSNGDVHIEGWDRSEVKVTATSARQLELQTGGANPSQRVEVAVSNRPKMGTDDPLLADCRGVTDLSIFVPRGATIQIQLRSGDIEISHVAEVRLKNTNGDVSLSNVTRAVEATTLSGDLSLMNSQGRVRLTTVGGDIDAVNIQTVNPSDDFSANSTSGDIDIENVSHARVVANTTSSMITISGKLAPGGSYDVSTMSGDVELNIPQDSAFQISARAPQGSITTDFAIKSASERDSASLLENGTLMGTYGKGDLASITIHSFSGAVRLLKR